MSSQRPVLFDSSVAALVLVNARHGSRQSPAARMRGLFPRLIGGSATAIPIQFAPEDDPAAALLELGENQATGPLPIGFEFEFFGERYTWFDLSSDGFMTFGAHSSPEWPGPRSRFIAVNATRSNFITLGWTDVGLSGRRHVAYEVRGAPHRRRLVLSFSRIPASFDAGLGTMIAQLVLHERTGMIDVHTTRRDPAANSVKQEAVRFTTAA
jgi:hypothetical protein